MNFEKYLTYGEIDGVKYEVITAHTDLFGNQLYQAATLQQETHPTTVRRVIGTFKSRAKAMECLDAIMREQH